MIQRSQFVRPEHRAARDQSATTIAAAMRQSLASLPAPTRSRRRSPSRPATTTPSRRSTATDASASLPRRCSRARRPYARAASPPTPAGRKLPTNELTRNSRVASRGRDRDCRWRAAAGPSAGSSPRDRSRPARARARDSAGRSPRSPAPTSRHVDPHREDREDDRGDREANEHYAAAWACVRRRSAFRTGSCGS